MRIFPESTDGAMCFCMAVLIVCLCYSCQRSRDKEHELKVMGIDQTKVEQNDEPVR